MKPVLVAFVVIATACGTAAGPPSTTMGTVTTSTTEEPLQPLQPAGRYEVQPCGSAPSRPWSLLCRGHDLLIAHHIDMPEPASLAAAAVAGARLLPRPAETPPPTTPPETRPCVIPDPAYSSLCDAIAEGLADGLELDALVEASVQGVFRFGLDPFSAYLAPDYAARIDALGTGQVSSLGLIVGARDGSGQACGPISESCVLGVLAVFDFLPAATGGVLVGDTITAIDGAPTRGLSEAEAVAALHGSDGMTTVITIVRPTGPTDKTLTHEDIPLAAVEYGMITDAIGYLRVNDFSQEAAQAVGQVLSLPEMQGAGGLVLDLRDNPGGLVMSARAVASQFLRDGIVATEESRQGAFELSVIRGGLAPEEMEVVVLVNAGTASAAEIVAAALQAQGRAQVIGERTFGKNLVQEIFEAPGGGEYRISVARWAGPDGFDVGVGGLVPDLRPDPTATGADPALDLAIGLLSE